MKILLKLFSSKVLFVTTLMFSSFTISIVQAQDNGEVEISQAELEQVLAPIALYPDTILSHILVASTYPLEVVQAERWVLNNEQLEGQNTVAAAEDKDWDPSVQALLAFPQILKRMSQDLNWTQRLGDAFLQGEERVLASVQNLRELAQAAGNLDDMERMTATREKRNIIIEPREREVVYVPYYDTRVVYGAWPWQHYQPTYWNYPYAGSRYSGDYYARNRHTSFYWGPRISLSFGFFSNSFNWRNNHIVRISSRHYQPRRYYNRRDILSHRYAERWVHNSNRRFGNHRRHAGSQFDRRGRDDRAYRNGRKADRVHSDRGRQQSRQRELRNRLVNRRSSPVDNSVSNRITTPRNRSVSNRSAPIYQNTTVNRNTLVNRNSPPRATTNSRVVLPRRDRAVGRNSATANPQVSRPVNRATTARIPQRPATRAVQQRVENRSVAKADSAPPKVRSAHKNEIQHRR
jgi:hypothetical protein